ncbi:MAG: lysyl endopeptidase [Flavobacteriales bacterium]|jgi:lysyl endopeptidase
MKRIYLITLGLLTLSAPLTAQISQGGEPVFWQTEESFDLHHFVTTPALDMAAIHQEDVERDQYKEFGYRFGIDFEVDLNTENSGDWEILEDGSSVWRLGIRAPEAVAISMRFNEYKLPAGAELFIYDVNKTHFLGSFTKANNKKWGSLATSLCYAETVIVEFHLPSGLSQSDWKLNIDQITHAYRGMKSNFEALSNSTNRGPFGNSGACNIDVNCPEGAEWQIEKKSAVIIVFGGSGYCSGAMVNNTAQDGTPYFLTANHCLGGQNNWVFYFNHEAAECDDNSGPTDQSITGASLKASNADSDFGLLELSSAPPADWGIQFAGWDNSDATTVTGTTGIHHPSGDLKKICHDEDAPYHANQAGAAVWYIDEWEAGVTEGGSSGSPLFDQNHRIIGQLYGGYAACAGSQNNGDADWYGRFGVSWDGSSASTRLRDWLDPSDSGVTILDGWPEGFVAFNNDAAAQGFNNLPSSLCSAELITPEFNLKNNGDEALMSCTITYSINGDADQTIDWTGDLAPSAAEIVELDSFNPQTGTNTVEVEVSNPNGVTDENDFNNSSSGSFVYAFGQTVINVQINTDEYGYETYWEIRKSISGQVIASGGNPTVGINGAGLEEAADTDPGAYANEETINTVVNFVNDGCYEFVIIDDYDDGICCDFGDGSYVVTDGEGTVLTSGGAFAGSEASEFGMQNGTSVEELNRPAFDMYPNPSTGLVTLVLSDKLTGQFTIDVTDLMGRTVHTQVVNNETQIVLNLDALSQGSYLVIMKSTEKIFTQQLQLR